MTEWERWALENPTDAGRELAEWAIYDAWGDDDVYEDEIDIPECLEPVRDAILAAAKIYLRAQGRR